MTDEEDTDTSTALRDAPVSRLSDYLTVKEAAEYLGVSRSTLRRWDYRGKLTAYRHPINGYRLYRIGDLRKLLSRIGRKEAKEL